ncbi:hypothetical protein AAHA92_18113 [Salvia divinorum]|uniref:Uncharacterized protein n=1 Tax=Salvia divinorum TaxID=28513 RepID=A0ABD1H116_SALDI
MLYCKACFSNIRSGRLSAFAFARLETVFTSKSRAAPMTKEGAPWRLPSRVRENQSLSASPHSNSPPSPCLFRRHSTAGSHRIDAEVVALMLPLTRLIFPSSCHRFLPCSPSDSSKADNLSHHSLDRRPICRHVAALCSIFSARCIFLLLYLLLYLLA